MARRRRTTAVSIARRRSHDAATSCNISCNIWRQTTVSRGQSRSSTTLAPDAFPHVRRRFTWWPGTGSNCRPSDFQWESARNVESSLSEHERARRGQDREATRVTPHPTPRNPVGRPTALTATTNVVPRDGPGPPPGEHRLVGWVAGAVSSGVLARRSAHNRVLTTNIWTRTRSVVPAAPGAGPIPPTRRQCRGRRPHPGRRGASPPGMAKQADQRVYLLMRRCTYRVNLTR